MLCLCDDSHVQQQLSFANLPTRTMCLQHIGPRELVEKKRTRNREMKRSLTRVAPMKFQEPIVQIASQASLVSVLAGTSDVCTKNHRL